MVVRYPLECSHCGAITILRIQVSYRGREPFRFECTNCGQSIQGLHVTDPREATLGIHELTGAIMVRSEDGAAYTHTFSPDFATNAEHAGTLGPSPFLTAHMHLGNMFGERMARVMQFYNLLAHDGNDLQRVARNFASGNWEQFAVGIAKYLPQSPVVESIDRQRALFQLTELALGPVFSAPSHVSVITGMHDVTMEQAHRSRSALLAMIDEAFSHGYLGEARRDLLGVVWRFLERADDFRSVLPFWDPEGANFELPAGFAVTAPRAFHELKSLYVDAYEAIARTLTLTTALANLTARGDHNSYVQHPILGKKFAPKSMHDFHRRSNAPKLAYLSEAPWLGHEIVTALDPALRNAIGHNSSQYNAQTGAIEYTVDKKGTIKAISYGDFLFAILRLVRVAFQLAHFTKQLYVHGHLGDTSQDS